MMLTSILISFPVKYYKEFVAKNNTSINLFFLLLAHLYPRLALIGTFLLIYLLSLFYCIFYFCYCIKIVSEHIINL